MQHDLTNNRRLQKSQTRVTPASDAGSQRFTTHAHIGACHCFGYRSLSAGLRLCSIRLQSGQVRTEPCLVHDAVHRHTHRTPQVRTLRPASPSPCSRAVPLLLVSSPSLCPGGVATEMWHIRSQRGCHIDAAHRGQVILIPCRLLLPQVRQQRVPGHGAHRAERAGGHQLRVQRAGPVHLVHRRCAAADVVCCAVAPLPTRFDPHSAWAADGGNVATQCPLMPGK